MYSNSNWPQHGSIVGTKLEFDDFLSLKFHESVLDNQNMPDCKVEISSLKFDSRGDYLFCANSKGMLHIYEFEKCYIQFLQR